MKKILFALASGFISVAAPGISAQAQNAAIPVAFNDSHFMPSIRNAAALESTTTLGTYIPDAKKVNAKAVKDFNTRFAASGSNATWYTDQNGLVSYFVKDGYGDRAYYDKKGRWQHTLLFYGEDKLPKDIRKLVRSTFFDLSISLVEEVQTNNGNGYVIHLEDKSNIKIIKVNSEGEMSVMQELIKE